MAKSHIEMDYMKNLTATISITFTKEFRFRMWLMLLLLNLAMKIAPFTGEIEVYKEDGY